MLRARCLPASCQPAGLAKAGGLAQRSTHRCPGFAWAWLAAKRQARVHSLSVLRLQHLSCLIPVTFKISPDARAARSFKPRPFDLAMPELLLAADAEPAQAKRSSPSPLYRPTALESDPLGSSASVKSASAVADTASSFGCRSVRSFALVATLDLS